MKFTLITGNPHKLKEWRRLIPESIQVEHIDIDLEEIQSADSTQIIKHKLRQAYAITKQAVVVEDVSFGLNKINGLPGPFIKFFYKELGGDALYKIAGKEAAATATCTIGFYDGTNEIIVDATVNGTAVAARGEGFGVDPGFQPEGSNKTFAEMTETEKDVVSHRRLAVEKLLKRLKEL